MTLRNILCCLAVLAVLVVPTACHEEADDLFATALITVSAGDGADISQVQAQAQLTNINTRQVTTTADFQGATARVELLRGAYQVSIEGVVTYRDASGQQHIRQFRAQTDYVELVEKGANTTMLNMIFLD